MPGFFNRLPAMAIWRCATGVSNAGRKKGRGQGIDRVKIINYNRGQHIGEGRRKLILPALNAPVVQGKTISSVSEVGPNPDFDRLLEEGRTGTTQRFGRRIELPLERGWSGRRAVGRSVGQPNDREGSQIDDFDSTVLMFRRLLTMNSLGRKRQIRALVVTGNGNGLAGFAYGVGNDGRALVRKLRDRAYQQLMWVPRWDGHTVMHDFFSKYDSTTVFVKRKPKGYGLVCQRAIKAICKAYGITDIHAKIEGSLHPMAITKAFFMGLINQRKYEDMAEDKRLHLVELREDEFNYPRVLASPKSKLRTDEQLKSSTENLDFTYYIYDGKVFTTQTREKNVFAHLPSWQKHLDRVDYEKNREKTKLTLAAKYGNKRVLDVFPHFRSKAKSFKEPAENEAR